MTTLKWSSGTASSKLTTELNSLASGALSSGSAAIDNASGLYQYMDAELFIATGTTPPSNAYYSLYLFKSIDGSNFEDISTAAKHAIVGVFPVANTSAAHRVVLSNILIPPLQFKVALENNTTLALPTGSNTLKIARHYEQSV